jgi:hypothetical protein
MPFALAAVPILGSLVFLGCAQGALFVDWCEQRRAHALSVGANIGGPVLVRYFSLIDPKESPTPHCLFATGQGGCEPSSPACDQARGRCCVRYMCPRVSTRV